jgi:hypothetical protein
VLYPGEVRYDLEPRVGVVPLAELAQGGAALVTEPSAARRRRT